VDSSKLFEFVESLRDPKENWVFPFESAQDITETLRTQLAYLFLDALTIRSKVLRCGLSETTMQDLSGAALLLAVQKPFAWEYRLFSQILCDEILRVSSIKKDLNYGLALGNAMSLDNSIEFMKYMQKKIGEMMSLLDSANVLFKEAIPKAFGAPGEPGDVEEIIYATKRLAQVYRRILEWTLEFRNIQVEAELSHLLGLTARMSQNAIEEIESFAVDCYQQIDSAVRRNEEFKQPQTLNLNLTLTCPDMTEFDGEFQRLQKLWGLK
jgi:hypothetical protein